jgi:lysophospholipase L1-like esterase
MTAYRRFVALGDSQTEGLNDGSDHGVDGAGFRGWADRLAEHLAATTSPDLLYANLAVRGCRARHVVETQLPAALTLEPDLATVVVGMNDVLRHDFDLDATVDHVERTFAELTATGCRVYSMTFPDIGRMLPVMAWLRPREATLNERLSEAARRHGVEMLDLFPLELCGDPRMWSHDRIHGSTIGHTLIGAGMAELLDLPGSDHTWAAPLPDPPGAGLLSVVRREAGWATGFMAPFLLRQLRGHGPMRDHGPKRPGLLPVTESAVVDGTL